MKRSLTISLAVIPPLILYACTGGQQEKATETPILTQPPTPISSPTHVIPTATTTPEKVYPQISIAPVIEREVTREDIKSWTANRVYFAGVSESPQKVLIQPHDNTAWVSFENGTVTQNITKACNIGGARNCFAMFFHNFLEPGLEISQMEKEDAIGSEIYIQNEEGQTIVIRVSEVQEFRATNPTSYLSNFISLADEQEYTTESLFYHLFIRPDITVPYAVFQTCIPDPENPDDLEWARRYLIGQVVEVWNMSLDEYLDMTGKSYATLGE